MRLCIAISSLLGLTSVSTVSSFSTIPGSTLKPNCVQHTLRSSAPFRVPFLHVADNPTTEEVTETPATDQSGNKTVAETQKKQGGAKKTKKKWYKKRKKWIKKTPLKDLVLGTEIEGNITNIKPYGAFVMTEYAIGGNGCALLHKSQIQNERVEDVNDVLKVGQKIKARVITIDYDQAEVGLSTRPKRSPRKPISDVEVGKVLEGKVKSIKDYGAFVDIGYKNDALLHISRITLDKVENINDHLKEGQKVKIRIINVDQDKETIAGSMLPKLADAHIEKRRRSRPKVEPATSE